MADSKKPKNFRTYSMQNISVALDKVTKPVFQKKGFAENKIITDWDWIVGKEIGKFSFPKKIYFRGETRSEGTLHVEVWDSGIANDMMYMEPIIIEKIAKYFGFKAVAKIKIMQNPSIIKKAIKDIPKIDKESINNAEEYAKTILADVDDPELKKALESLGKSIFLEEKNRSN